jgi:3-mercaptopropionate dioxygenase
MCDLGHAHDHQPYGFLVDTAEIRALIDETKRLTAAIPDTAARVDALRPAFAALLASDGWLPDSCATPDATSKMGGGIGQYALYRAEDKSLCLFSLVVPAGAATPVHDHKFDPSSGIVTPFRSGYATAPCPDEA